MRYTNWSDVVARYPGAAKVAGAEAVAIENAFIAGAESEIDAKLAVRYAVPFATTPTLAPGIIRDVATDLTYYRIMLLGLRPEQSTVLWDSIERRLDALATGSMAIVTSGGVVLQVTGGVVWGSHMTYPNVTGMDDVQDWKVSDEELDDTADRRNS